MGRGLVSRRVAVIGAGPSGLVTVKELLDQGHRPVCFEKAGSLGGVFRFGEHDGVVWESCRLTSSGVLTAFSDFPVTPERAGHMSVAEYVNYLHDYCRVFDVDRYVRYRSTVERVSHTPGGG
jgi:dimethylaniline monooxygenase (N-oxide forming)